MNQLENQTLALAGMFQAATLVDELALHGKCNSDEFDCSFDSLFTIEADTPREALGDIACLVHGFTALADYLGGENRTPGRNIAYYLLSMLKLSNQVLRDEALSELLLKGLHRIDSDRSSFDMSRHSVIHKIKSQGAVTRRNSCRCAVAATGRKSLEPVLVTQEIRGDGAKISEL